MRNRKNCWMLLCCLLCLCLLCAGAQAAEKPVIRSSARMRYAVSDSYVWTVTEEGIISCYDTEKMIRTEAGTLQNVSHVAAGGERLYCLSVQDGQQSICTFTPGSGQSAVRTLETDFAVVQMEAADWLYLLGDDGCIYWAVDRGSSMPYAVIKWEVAGWQNESISAIAVYGGYVCTYSRETGLLSVIRRMQTEDVLLNPPVRAEGLCYVQIGQSREGALYIYALRDAKLQAGLIEINAATGESRTSELLWPGLSMGLRRNADTLYTLSEDGRELYAVSLAGSKAEKARTLTLLNTFFGLEEPSPLVEAALADFAEKYPDIRVTESWINDVRVIATGIMAGTEGYDVTTIQENYTLISSMDMYRAGASVNLEEIPQIAQVLSECADVLAPVTAEGHLLGIPEFYNPYLWSVNTSLADSLGAAIPRDGWTWEDFFALAEQVKQYNDCHAEKIWLLEDNIGTLPYFLVQYNANTVDVLKGTARYDAKEFVDALEKWTQLCREELVLFRTDGGNPRALLRSDCAVSYQMAVEGAYGELILPPVFDAQTRYPVNVARTVINANSPCREEAKYLISLLFTRERLRQNAYCANNGCLLRADMEKELKNDPDGNKRVWYAIMENAVQDYYVGDLYKDQWKQLYPQLMDGTLSPAEYAQICQMRAEMVLSE